MSAKEATALGAVGVTIGGGIATMFFGFLSFFLGAIMLIIGIFILKSVKKEIHTTGKIAKSGKVNLKSIENEGDEE